MEELGEHALQQRRDALHDQLVVPACEVLGDPRQHATHQWMRVHVRPVHRSPLLQGSEPTEMHFTERHTFAHARATKKKKNMMMMRHRPTPQCTGERELQRNTERNRKAPLHPESSAQVPTSMHSLRHEVELTRRKLHERVRVGELQALVQ
jgi:hypothetical protein